VGPGVGGCGLDLEFWGGHFCFGWFFLFFGGGVVVVVVVVVVGFPPPRWYLRC
jgi:hypothetical protein